MKLLIELPTWLGDCVMATPAIENIIRKFPRSELIFIGSSVPIELMENHPNCRQVFILEKNLNGLRNQAKKLGKFDLFISFRSSIRSKFLKYFVNAEKKFQFKKKKYPTGHQVEKYNSFINSSLNLNNPPSKLKIYNQFYSHSKKKPLLGISPGASYGSAKCWPHEKFTEVVISLSSRFDILIFGGPKEEVLAEKITYQLKESNCKNFTNLVGKTNINELVNYLSSLDLFITGDSGPMHIAASLKIPTVTIFGPTKALETGQWMNKKSIILKKELPCQPCMKRVCPLGHHDCMRKISSEEVINSALSLI